jgi:MULE transposase-like protein
MLPLEAMRFLPINRNIDPKDEKQILLLKEVGLKVRQIIRVLELQKNVKHGELPFIKRDLRNLFGKMKRFFEVDDVTSLLEYMKLANVENKKFQYAFTMDEEGRPKNLFWCPAECFDWYQMYGDVVVFDTTYKVNAYDFACGIFVGIDNHGKTILFACALLRNETTTTFSWLMKVLLLVYVLVKLTPNQFLLIY